VALTPYRRSVVSDEISQDLDRAIALAREFGIEGLDIRSVWGKTVHELDDDELRRLKGAADAAGLAILPGLVRYDEVFGAAEIGHAFRVTLRATNGCVYPASHRAGSTTGALPMGARLRLKAAKDLTGFRPEIRKIFRAMQRYGLIVADNGSDLYVSGTYDTRWDNSVLNPAFRALTAADFDVVTLGFRGIPPDPPTNVRIVKVP